MFNGEKRFEQSQKQPQAEKKGLWGKYKEQSTGKKFGIGIVVTAATGLAAYGIVKGVKYGWNYITKKKVRQKRS